MNPAKSLTDSLLQFFETPCLVPVRRRQLTRGQPQPLKRIKGANLFGETSLQLASSSICCLSLSKS
jgi:hypothetical protein